MRPTVVTVGMLRAGTAPNVIGGTAVVLGFIVARRHADVV